MTDQAAPSRHDAAGDERGRRGVAGTAAGLAGCAVHRTPRGETRESEECNSSTHLEVRQEKARSVTVTHT